MNVAHKVVEGDEESGANYGFDNARRCGRWREGEVEAGNVHGGNGGSVMLEEERKAEELEERGD
jgi:hypothetical protein